MRAARTTRRAVAGVLVGVVATGAAALGAGSSVAAAAPTEVTCTIDGTSTKPVSVTPGTSVQLVLVLPLLGTRVTVGAPVTVDGTGTRTLQGTVTSLVGGVLGSVCRAAVTVQSAVPIPSVALPTIPNAVPPITVVVPELPDVPVPGAAGGTGSTPPSTGTSPGTGGGTGSTPAAGPAGTGGSTTTGTGGGRYVGAVQGAALGDLLNPVASGGSTAYSFGRVPLYSYAGTPYAVAGGSGRALSPDALYGGSTVPGFAPQFGILGGGAAAGPGDGVSDASQVQALGAGAAAGTIGVITLVAVLLLSGTSAAVVRTWVLRRTAPAVTA